MAAGFGSSGDGRLQNPGYRQVSAAGAAQYTCGSHTQRLARQYFCNRVRKLRCDKNERKYTNDFATA